MNFEISSKDNPTYKNLKKLLTSKGIKEDKKFFLMGEKLIQEFLKTKHPTFKVDKVITFDGSSSLPLLDRSIKLKKDLFNELDVLGTHYPLLVLDYKDFENHNFNQAPEGLELICPLGDPKNLGALVRSAVAFQAKKIILTHESCHPYLPHAVKASAGAVLHIPIAISSYKVSDIPLTGTNYALDLKGTAISSVKWDTDCRLWIGEEGPGLQISEIQKKRLHMVSIPTYSVESLNATVSASIALWQYANRY